MKFHKISSAKKMFFEEKKSCKLFLNKNTNIYTFLKEIKKFTNLGKLISHDPILPDVDNCSYDKIKCNM